MESSQDNTANNLSKDQEIVKLLAINKAITEARNVVELLATIREKVMELIPFYDTGILIVEKDGLHHYDMAVNIQGWDETEGNKKLQDMGLLRIDHPGSYVNFVMNLIEEKQTPVIEEYAIRMTEFDYPFFSIIQEIGYKESIVALLKSGGRTYGTLWLNSLEKNHFTKEQFPLFQAITEQVSVAVANILANEEILTQSQEKDILLAISNKLSIAIKVDEVLQIIINEVKPIFQFYDTGIIIVDENAMSYYDLSVVYPHIDGSDVNNFLNNKGYYNENQSIKLENSVVAWIMQQFELGKTPLIFDYLQDYSSYSDSFLLSDLKDSGYIYAWMCPLKQTGKTFGFLSINFTKGQTIPLKKQVLILALADRIASSIANILANEEILEREKEKTLLLNISNSIAQINNKVDLLKSIDKLLWPIFHHDDAGFSIVDKDKKFFTDYHILYSTEIPNSDEAKYLNSVIYKELYSVEDSTIPFPGSIVEHYMYRKPEMGMLKDVMPLNLNEDQLQLEIQQDLVYYICAPLTTGGKNLGLFNLLFKEGNKPTSSSLGLFAQIAEIMALAFSNILANEEIQKREYEKTQLLKISEAIASIKNYKELLTVIYKVIQPVFHFENTGIFVRQKQTDNLIEITDAEILEGRVSASFTEAKISGLFAIQEFMKKSWVHSDIPLITNLTKELNYINNPVCKEQFQLSIKSGLQDMICGPLFLGGQKIGSIYFSTRKPHYYGEKHKSLFKSITHFVAISVGNILSNEDILEREREKIVLLSLSENMANIRNREDLLQTMLEKIKPMVNFDDAVISKYSSDFTQYQHIITSSPTERKQHPMYTEIVGKPLPVKNNPDEYVLENIQKEDVLEYDTENMIAMYPEHFIGHFLKENGLMYNLYFKLVWAGDIIGFMNFHFTKKDTIEKNKFGLYKSIADQVSVALANILANEELVAKAKEIEGLNKQLQVQNEYLIEEVEQQYNFDEMIGQNTQFVEVCRNIGLVAKTDTSVLILGETGTGKELVARAIHNNSSRKNKPLIKLNCAALPANLIESELFGHERGAFTGAIERRIGKFELANGSTLFLDEVGELPLELQSKLLRALQEKEIERLGSNKTLQMDVRIIAATNRELEKEVQVGKFRQDLYYRLHIFPINLPALRERKEDIPLLATHFIERYTKKTGKKIQGLSSSAMQEMMSYNWPGNIRELEHTIERSVILAKTKVIQDMGLPLNSKKSIITSSPEFVIKTWEEQERDYILEVLKVTKGNMAGKGGAAELLQLPPTTLQSKMNRLGIKRKHFIVNKDEE